MAKMAIKVRIRGAHAYSMRLKSLHLYCHSFLIGSRYEFDMNWMNSAYRPRLRYGSVLRRSAEQENEFLSRF